MEGRQCFWCSGVLLAKMFLVFGGGCGPNIFSVRAYFVLCWICGLCGQRRVTVFGVGGWDGFVVCCDAVVWWLLSGGGRSAGDGWCGCGVTVSVGIDWWTVARSAMEGSGGLVSGVLLRRFWSAWWGGEAGPDLCDWFGGEDPGGGLYEWLCEKRSPYCCVYWLGSV